MVLEINIFSLIALVLSVFVLGFIIGVNITLGNKYK